MPQPNNGALTEAERAEAARNHASRKDMPAGAFLEPEARKYPVKVHRDGAWHYDRDLLLAAAREARMHGHDDLAARADTIRKREFGSAADALALDQKANRSYDKFNRLHVAETNISKANVCGYYGREIPNAKDLGLESERLYQLYRDPAELKKGAPTFNNIPLLSRHVATDANNPQKQSIAGTLGTDAAFDAPYLRNSLSIWSQPDIDDVESGEKVQLSASYAYKAVMESGVAPDGTPFDGRMTEIVGNHVALVGAGRAGPDVLVADEALPTPIDFQLKDTAMTHPLSGKAQLARGALAAWLPPKLAADAKVDLRTVLMGTTAQNWAQAKPQIVQRLKEATHGKLAKDATLDDVHGLLDRLDGEAEERAGDDEAETDEEREARMRKRAADKAARDRKAARDAAAPEEQKRMDEEDERKRAEDRKRARDEDPDMESEDERTERLAKRASDKKARDAETPEQKEKRERDEREAADRKRASDKKAMDEAIASALTGERQRQADLRTAERAVRPLIGELPLAQDSAEAVYRLALDSLGIKHVGVHPTALPALVDMATQQRKRPTKPAALANDAAFSKAHPDVARIRVI
jgi:hypothetical protein